MFRRAIWLMRLAHSQYELKTLSKGIRFSAGEFTGNMNRRYSIENTALVKDRTESSNVSKPFPTERSN
jgi:hypothetical protein